MLWRDLLQAVNFPYEKDVFWLFLVFMGLWVVVVLARRRALIIISRLLHARVNDALFQVDHADPVTRFTLFGQGPDTLLRIHDVVLALKGPGMNQTILGDVPDERFLLQLLGSGLGRWGLGGCGWGFGGG